MALQAAYVQFLTAPNLAALAEKATLNYITTTTSISGAGEVVKHLNGLHSHVKKNKETLLSAIEGRDGLALAIEMDTSLEFVISGGPYLPGLDDNFLADRKIQVCIVRVPREYYSRPLRFIRMSVLLRSSLTNHPVLTDPHCRIRLGRQDCPNPPVMGPGLAPQAGRCHW